MEEIYSIITYDEPGLNIQKSWQVVNSYCKDENERKPD